MNTTQTGFIASRKGWNALMLADSRHEMLASERNTKTVAMLSAVADQVGDAATVLTNTMCWRSAGQSWLHIEYEGGTYEGDRAIALLAGNAGGWLRNSTSLTNYICGVIVVDRFCNGGNENGEVSRFLETVHARRWGTVYYGTEVPAQLLVEQPDGNWLLSGEYTNRAAPPEIGPYLLNASREVWSQDWLDLGLGVPYPLNMQGLSTAVRLAADVAEAPDTHQYWWALDGSRWHSYRGVKTPLTAEHCGL